MMKISEVLEGVLKRLEKDSDALIFFESFLLGDLIYEINQNLQSGQIDKEADINNQKAWLAIYHLAAELAYDAAMRNHSEVHPDIFEEAERAIKALKQELEEKLGIEVESIEMKSPSTLMAEAGLVEIKDGMVELTEKGRQTAQEFEKMLQSKSN